MFWLSENWLAGFWAAFFRSLGVLALLPFGSVLESCLRRVMFALVLGALLASFAGGSSSDGLVALSANFLVGVLVGLPFAIAVEAGGMLGELFDSGRGQNLASFYDPLSDIQQSQLAVCSKLMVWATLLISGALERVVLTLKQSFAILPCSEDLLTRLPEIGMRLLIVLDFAFTGTVALFLPLALVFLLSDCLVGGLSKILPGANFYGDSFQLKSYVGLLLLVVLVHDDWSGQLITLCTSLGRAFLG
ncbi:MAG: flagellar biosynthetic protein FliR [Deltaproteobacteria bacterium]|nr:flagellar biosynthetic protein FliR [Deltaproteobacteria bacterium]